MITPYACVDQDAVWLPRGPLEPGEPELGRAIQFLSDAQRSRLIDWWLAVRKDSARIPNWDIVANCRFGNRPGLTLVEAKAHPAELGEKDSSKASSDNRRQIDKALTQAQKGLNDLLPEWALDANAHYQISNRFAWAWKVASMGVPVALVYLGFLNATEMLTDSRPVLRSSEEWEDRVRNYSKGIVPPGIWNSAHLVDGTPLIALIRSAEVTVTVRSVG